MNDNISWSFFAAQAKPTSMRRAIAEQLSEREAVVIVEQPVSLVRDRAFMPLSGRCLPFGTEGNSWHYRPMHFPEKLPGVGRIFKALNEKLIQREIDRLLPFQMDRIVCYDSPTQYPLVKKFRERQSVYLAVDDRTRTVWGDPISGEAEAERRLLGKVDQVICVSESLSQILKSRTPEGRTPPIFVLPNGYDERIFDSSMDYPEPSFLKDVPRPRILIAGHVSERIDWDGIAAGSLLRPDWTWIFLGPADPGMEERLRSLLDSRALLHPSVPLNSVPAWIQHCEACAVPYGLNEFTKASNPLKAIEYLAMGRPVLSTKIPSLNSYGEVIEWVQEGRGDSYASALDRFLSDGRNGSRRQERCNSVRCATWKIKAEQFRSVILN
jgi:glycosyltransferase involved in cell wall biosynthesis